MSTFYEALGVPETASQEDIKKAYRKLSLQYHPDRNGNSAESTAKFQSISAAYDVLGDEDKRRQHDMQTKMQNAGGGGMQGGGMPFSFMPFHFSQGGGGGMPFGQPTSFFTTNGNGGEFDPADLLNFVSSNFFGGGAGTGNGGGNGNVRFTMDNLKQRMAKPVPIVKTETIPLSKAYTGYNMPIEITRWIVENELKREETETIYLPIPAGVDNNEIIILRDKGHSLAENNKGDIKVFIKILNDTEFVRNGLDLVLNKTIGLKDALCGFAFDMTFVDGRTFKVNNNVGNIITHNYNKVIAGLGMKREEHVGNLIIQFNVTFPDQLSAEQIEALQKILP
jgi:DnaJ-class molecular chaperone